jgi:hypothetical protein
LQIADLRLRALKLLFERGLARHRPLVLTPPVADIRAPAMARH